MKITVVTVCLNVEETIEATIQSVLAQTYQDIEYLIIDGMSNDGTINIINKYVNDKRIRFFSEKDNGIYNAMNKALGICTGKYIIYMNSGDVFYDDKVLEDMVPNFQYDLVYGNALIKTRLGDKLETYQGKWKMIYWLFIGRMMSHQSLFVKTDIMHLYQFNECFQIRADYDFIIRALKDKRSLKYID
ncbi:MAG: glycosyltransferase [Lachnospiraceae bacterium]|nr:glycosyltransferase [Lachnospiraceae bacterium]